MTRSRKLAEVATSYDNGTANGVAYLNGSRVLTTGSALTFDGTGIFVAGSGGSGTSNSLLRLNGSDASSYGAYLQLQRNGVNKWTIGTDSGINGGTSDDLTIYGTANQRFYASGTEGMRLTSTGLGIGTSSPGQKLEIASANSAGSYATMRLNSPYYNYFDFVNDGGLAFKRGTSEYMRIDSSGNLLVGTTTLPFSGTSGTISSVGSSVHHYQLRNTGAAAGRAWRICADTGNTFYILNQDVLGVSLGNGASSWGSVSDERLKTSLVPITEATNKVLSLRAVTGRYKTDEENVSRSFLIAQDVQSVFPEAVDATNPESLSLRYTDVIPLLVAAIKELKDEVAALKGA